MDEAPQLIVQIGSSPTGTSATDWMYWGAMEPNPDSSVAPGIGEDEDEYRYIGAVIESLGDWDHLVRVSGDSGATWTYCNANRPGDGYNGTDSDNPYDLTKNGHFTVTSPCGEGFCNEANKTVCDDSDSEPFYTCSCDEHYNDNDADGDCDLDTQLVACTNSLPANAVWRTEGIYGGGKLTQTWNDGWEPEADTCPWDCDDGYHQEGETCVSNDPRTAPCVDNKPSLNSHWVAEGDYNGDGTVNQTWTGTAWQPPADECPWACDVDHHFRYDPLWGPFCDPDTRTVACTNELPLGAQWTAGGVYDGEGNLTQTWDAGVWGPATDTCPSECPSDTHWNGAACAPNSRFVGCGFDLPANATWVADLPTYDGFGNLNQTWNPETTEYEPGDMTCPFNCTEPGYHPNTEVNKCLLTYAVGWCNTQSPTFHNGMFDSWLDVYGQLWIDGVTNLSDINNTEHTIAPYLPQIKAQLGAGRRDTTPGVDKWDWLDAIPNEDYGNNDEYMLHVQLHLPPALYDYAYRFSGDSGQTWTYCDLNGSGDGYQIANAGKLTVMCAGNSDCTESPDGPICAPWQMCVECMTGTDCESWEQCNGAFACEPQDGRCNENADCADEVGLPVCDTANHDCVDNKPASTTVDDANDTFDWAYVPGYTDVSWYECTVDGGANWVACGAKPLLVGNYDLAIDMVGVRFVGDDPVPQSSGVFNEVAFTIKVPNGDFETWSNGTVPDFWTFDGEVGVVRESTIVRNGNSSVKLIRLIDNNANTDFMSDFVPVTEGAAYAITFYYFDDNTNARGSLYYSFYNASQVMIGSIFYTNIYTDDDPINWQTISATPTAPAGAAFLRVGTRVYKNASGGTVTGGFVYLDDVMVVKQ